jgi:peptidyl-prolyl cis-trans isomerase SurA
MLKKLFALTLLFSTSLAAAWSQNDPVLFTVAGKPVTVSEFRYIYTKTNQEKADFSETSLREYLSLYTGFKLKVAKARDMKLDTIEALDNELEGYRRQLAASYLVDKEVTDKLIKEAYDRMLQDVDISHIFLACDKNAKPADTLRVYNRAVAMMNEIRGGVPFEKMARDSSDDKSAKENSGNLGFVTAMLPDGYYNLEVAAYAGVPGTLNGPIRSNSGYHILRVNGFRPARGEMEVAQILFRKGANDDANNAIRRRVDSVYAALQAGADWNALCAKYTEDKTAATKGGYVGFFGINRYQKSFEDAAFALAADGDITKPVETSIGYHIIKRLSARPIGNFEAMRRPLSERVKRDSRSEIARQSMIARIKKEGSYEEYPDVLKKWMATQKDTVFLTFKWKPNPQRSQDVLMRFGKTKAYTVADFEDYCARASRERMRGAGNPLDETVNKLYKTWTEEASMAFEESQLDVKYPEFRSLMREYEEGILLFEALKINVWDRANTDTVGLQKFFDANLSQKYKWDERADVSFYTIKSDDPKLLADIREYAAKKPSADVLKKFNKKEEVVTVMEKRYERGKNKELVPIWKVGGMTEGKTDAGTKTATFVKVEKIIAPEPKTLAEARGYAVADYQDYLEKQWIEDLRKEYPVVVNEEVLKSMVVRRP